jgi:hypothetical protein
MHGMARCGSSPPRCRPPPYRGALGDRQGELAATREAIWEARWTSASTSAGDSWSRWAAPARSPARWPRSSGPADNRWPAVTSRLLTPHGARRLIRQRTKIPCTVEAASPTRGAIRAGPSRWVQRRWTTLRTTGAGFAAGSGGAAGPIRHPGRSLVPVALGPPLGGRPADLEPLSGPGGGPALLHDTAGQPQPAELAQGCVRVDYEDILVEWVLGSSTPDPEVPFTSILTRPAPPLRAVQLVLQPEIVTWLVSV